MTDSQTESKSSRTDNRSHGALDFFVLLAFVMCGVAATPDSCLADGHKSLTRDANESMASPAIVKLTPSSFVALHYAQNLGEGNADATEVPNAAADPATEPEAANAAADPATVPEAANATAGPSNQPKAANALAGPASQPEAASAPADTPKDKKPFVGVDTWSKTLAFILCAALLFSFFPLSARAFQYLEVPQLIAQMEKDHSLLGHESSSKGKGSKDKGSIEHRWGWISYLIHYSLAVCATISGVTLFFFDYSALLDFNTQRAMQFGFLGAYVYSLNLVYRRYTTLDLQPHVYLYCTTALISGILFNLVAFVAITAVASSPTDGDGFKGAEAGGAAILAFSLGYFPNMAIRWFGRVSRTYTRERERRSDALPLSMIDGISELHETRLQDEGIDNVQNLATANIPDLVVKTPFTAQELIEWTDQAILYLYLEPAGEITRFRGIGLRTVTDFQDIWGPYVVTYKTQADGTVERIPKSIAGDETSKEFEAKRKAIAEQLTTTEQRLDSLYASTKTGVNMAFVRNYMSNVEAKSIKERKRRFADQLFARVGGKLKDSKPGEEESSSDHVLRNLIDALYDEVNSDDVKNEKTPDSFIGQYKLMSVNNKYEIRRRDLLEEFVKEFPNEPAAYRLLAELDLASGEQSLIDSACENAKKAVELTVKPAGSREQKQYLIDLKDCICTLASAYEKRNNQKEIIELIGTATEQWVAADEPIPAELKERLTRARNLDKGA